MEFEMRYVWKILVGKREGRRTYHGMKSTWIVNIEMNLKRNRNVCSAGLEKDPVSGFCDHCNEY
jgi:hypothetical protein